MFKARFFTALMVFSALALFSTSVFAQDFLDIEPGAPTSNTLTSESPLQVYEADLTEGTYGIFLESDSAESIAVDVVRADGTSIVTNAIGAPGALSVTAIVTEAGVHYLVVTSTLAALGSDLDYDLTLSIPGDLVATPAPAGETPAVAPEAGQVVTTGFSVSLSWTGAADLDLEVRDPIGGSLYWETPSVDSGGSLSPNVNQACAVVNADTPSETATWTPGGIPTGSYELLVYFQQACAGDAPINFTITPSFNGEALPAISSSVSPGQVYVSRVAVFADGTTNVQQQGSIVVLENLPFAFADIQAAAQPLSIENRVSAFIGNDQPFVSYNFEGLANQILTIDLFATGGSLDTFVALLDSNGNLIAFNDDFAPGVTDSLIDGVLLPAAGTYYVVASRYGKVTGGTEGGFDLLVTEQTVNLSQEFLSLPEGSLEVLVLWNSQADLQLLVRDSAGDSVFDDVPRVPSGGVLGAQGNVNCRGSIGTPFSYVYWPLDRQPRPGSYEVELWFQNECNDTTPVTFTLYVTLNGRQVFRASDAPILNERYLTSFTLNPDGTFLPSDGGIIRGVDTLDYLPEVPSASAVLAGDQLVGNITPTNKFDVYTYSGAANTNITMSLNATSGTLDTVLYLISPSGQLIAENDDAVPGENTNSLIADFTLPEDGQYIIIVTHYGALYGGTTGTYTFTLTELS
jgi:hypothetical protein